ncbi:MAG: right-handed parallel beta-helix repeat-containing protein [bacterium]
MHRFLTALLFLALAPILAGSALASDGTLEINQACAVQTGCLAGDAPGLPVTITSPGSHQLTGNLDLPDVNTSGIVVTSPDVSLDLNGFGIRCPSCAGSGSGVGIDADATSDNLGVRNGSIVGVGSFGIRSMASHGRIEDMHIRRVGGTGIFQNGFDARVEDCTLVVIGDFGISVGQWSLITGNHLRTIGGVGILSQDGRVADNLVANSGSDGIQGFEAIVIGNRVSGSGGDGIDCAGCNVQDNDVSNSTGLGLAGSIFSNRPSAYGGNRFAGNNGGNANPQVWSGAIETSGNVCGTDTLCP